MTDRLTPAALWIDNCEMNMHPARRQIKVAAFDIQCTIRTRMPIVLYVVRNGPLAIEHIEKKAALRLERRSY